MRVAFDHQCFLDQTQGGITRYFIELITGLGRESGVDVLGWTGIHRSKAAVPFPGCRLPEWMVQTRGIRRITHRGAKWGFERWARSLAVDIYHPTYYEDLVGPPRAKRVVTIHDCIPERHCTLRGLDAIIVERKRRQLELADHVICVSQRTKDDVCELYGFPRDRATVVYHGVRPLTAPAETSASSPPFFLLVGQRSFYKNYAVVQKAWEMDKTLRRCFDLVCVGGPAMRRDERVAGATIRHLGYPDDDTLATLYARAAALIYPSRFEGFGLPLLEAMISRCPVVTTRGGAIPEIAGNAAEYFDADSPEDLVRALKAVAECSARRGALIASGLERASRFTWERCAEQTAVVYRRVADSG